MSDFHIFTQHPLWVVTHTACGRLEEANKNKTKQTETKKNFWFERTGHDRIILVVTQRSRSLSCSSLSVTRKKKQTLLRYYYINGLLRGFESERNRLKGRLPFPTYFSVSARAWQFEMSSPGFLAKSAANETSGNLWNRSMQPVLRSVWKDDCGLQIGDKMKTEGKNVNYRLQTYVVLFPLHGVPTVAMFIQAIRSRSLHSG